MEKGIQNSSAIGITGASGFIGKYITQKLLEEKKRVVVFVRSKNSISALLDTYPDLEVVEGTITDKEKINEFTSRCTSIIHLAAGTSGPWEEYFETSVHGSQALLEAAEKNHTQKLIYISSISIYDIDSVNSEQGIEETGKYDNWLDLRGWYAKAKALGEREVTSRFKSSNIVIAVFRVGLVYAKHMKDPLIGCGIKKRNFLILPGTKNKRIPFIHIDDLYSAIKTSLNQSTQSAIYNLVNKKQPAVEEVINEYKKEIDPSLRIITIPKWMFFGAHIGNRLLSKKTRLGKLSYLITRTQTNAYYSSNKIKQELHWEAKKSLENVMQEIKITRRTSFKAALIGCGYALRSLHLPFLFNNPNIEIISIYDANKKTAEEMRNAYWPHAQVLDHVEDVNTEKKSDIAIICTPPNTHSELVAECIKKGMHIVVEKPISLSEKETKELEKLRHDHRVRVCIMNNYRFRNNVKKLKSILQQTSHAAPQSIAVKFWSGPIFQSQGNWRKNFKDALLYEMAYHFIDLAVMFANAPISFDTIKTKRDTEEMLEKVYTTGKTSKNTKITFDLMLKPPKPETSVEIICENNTYILHFYPESLEIKNESSTLSKKISTFKEVAIAQFKKRITGVSSPSHGEVYQKFLWSLQTEIENTPISIKDILPTMQVLETLKQNQS